MTDDIRSSEDFEHFDERVLIDIIAGEAEAGCRVLRFDRVSGVSRLNTAAIQQRSGLDENQSMRVAAAFALAHRIRSQRAERVTICHTMRDVVDLLREKARLATQEQVWLVGLDPTKRLTGVRLVSIGTDDKAHADAGLVLRHACEIGAFMYVLVHFHVNGAQHPPKVSKQDLIMTAHIRDVGHELGMAMEEHLVIGRSGKAVSVLREVEKREAKEAARKAEAAKRKVEKKPGVLR